MLLILVTHTLFAFKRRVYRSERENECEKRMLYVRCWITSLYYPSKLNFKAGGHSAHTHVCKKNQKKLFVDLFWCNYWRLLQFRKQNTPAPIITVQGLLLWYVQEYLYCFSTVFLTANHLHAATIVSITGNLPFYVFVHLRNLQWGKFGWLKRWD